MYNIKKQNFIISTFNLDNISSICVLQLWTQKYLNIYSYEILKNNN